MELEELLTLQKREKKTKSMKQSPPGHVNNPTDSKKNPAVYGTESSLPCFNKRHFTTVFIMHDGSK
jgi:hypothetical protein